jgi:hypothetical protein
MVDGVKLVKVVASPKEGKKLRAVFQRENGRQFNRDFGSSGMDDYTKTHDKEQRTRYRTRHAKDLKGDPTRAGYLSYYILWGESTSVSANVASYRRRFGL